MTIDIERLKTDLDYWNSVAPEGATHYAQEETDYHEGWYKKAQDDIYFVPCGATAFNRKDVGSFSRRSCIIPRPSHTWNSEGLPPVGATEKDFCPTTAVPASLTNGGDYKCEVLAHRNGMAVVMVSASYGDRLHFVKPEHCRPLKTEKERLVEAAVGVCREMLFNESYAEQYADALYDAGMLKEPTND